MICNSATSIPVASLLSFYAFIALAALVAKSVRPFASHAEGWVFKSQLRQTYVVKIFGDSSTAKRSATGVSVKGPRR